MTFNIDIENGIKALFTLLMLVMAGISINFSYEGQILEAIYYLLGAVVTLLFYIQYRTTQLNRLNHARINLLTRELEDAGVIETPEKEQEKTGDDYLTHVKNKIDEVTNRTETESSKQIEKKVEQKDREEKK